MIRLCITADDYGLSPDVNAAIHALAAQQAISAVSLMVHRDALLADAETLRDTVATGLHLVLVGERPLLPDRLTTLLDADGFLPSSYGRLFLALARHPALLPRLADEIAAQLERYNALGLPLHFVNSHQHVHLLPPIWNHVLRVLDRTNGPGPAIRTAYRGPFGGVRQTLLNASSHLAWMLRPSSDRSTLIAIGVDFAGHTTLRDVDGVLGRVGRAAVPGNAVYELVMHPGLGAQVAATRHGAWGYRWRSEYDLLLSSDFAALLRRHVATVVRPDTRTAPMGAA